MAESSAPELNVANKSFQMFFKQKYQKISSSLCYIGVFFLLYINGYLILARRLERHLNCDPALWELVLAFMHLFTENNKTNKQTKQSAKELGKKITVCSV